MKTGDLKNIFLADDDPDDRLFFEDALKELGIKTELIMTNDGVELMTVLDHTVPPPPHVVFLDLNMPRKNGLECLAEIRRIQKLKNIPVVIFSTSDSPNTIDTTYSLGATYFICKPRSFDLFKKAIETILSFDSGLLAKQPPKENYFLQFA
jgi:DNA-binding NarL/FixJ family response regulator